MIHWGWAVLTCYLGMVVMAMLADAKRRDKRAGR